MLVPDGAYTFAHGQARFHRAPAPSEAELERLLDILIRRITRTLVRTGVLVKDPQQPCLNIYPDSGGDSTLEHRDGRDDFRGRAPAGGARAPPAVKLH